MEFRRWMWCLALGAAACAPEVGAVPDGGVADHAPPASPKEPVCPREVYEPWQTGEVYHLEGVADEYNAVFRPDGVVRWRVWGCDFFGLPVDARWRVISGTTIRIEPPPGETRLYWPGSVGGTNTYRWVEVERDVVLGTLRVVDGAPDPPPSRWMRGWACKICNRGGPWPVVLCDGDVPASHLACP